jgi:hypothetical protein
VPGTAPLEQKFGENMEKKKASRIDPTGFLMVSRIL